MIGVAVNRLATCPRRFYNPKIASQQASIKTSEAVIPLFPFHPSVSYPYLPCHTHTHKCDTHNVDTELGVQSLPVFRPCIYPESQVTNPFLWLLCTSGTRVYVDPLQ